MPSINTVDPQVLQQLLAVSQQETPQQEVLRFWNTSAPQGDRPAEIILDGVIKSKSWSEDDVTLKAFNEDLQALGDAKEIVVRINSSGGEVFAAFAIYSRLKDHPAKIIVKIDGWAASAATIIAMAGDEIHIPAAALFLVHDPMAGLLGFYNRAELREVIARLDKLVDAIVEAYSARTGKSKEEIQAIMAEETTYTGQEAVDNGFCDHVMFAPTATAQAQGVNVAAFTGQVGPAQANELLSHLYSAGVGGFAYEQQPQNNEKKENEHMEPKDIQTVEQLAAAYPQLVNSIQSAARAEGATAERQRIQGIENCTVEGYEAMATAAKFESPVEPGEFAMQLLATQRKQGETFLQNREKDVQASGMEKVPAAGVEVTPPAGEDGSMAELDAAYAAIAAEQKQGG